MTTQAAVDKSVFRNEKILCVFRVLYNFFSDFGFNSLFDEFEVIKLSFFITSLEFYQLCDDCCFGTSYFEIFRAISSFPENGVFQGEKKRVFLMPFSCKKYIGNSNDEDFKSHLLSLFVGSYKVFFTRFACVGVINI